MMNKVAIIIILYYSEYTKYKEFENVPNITLILVDNTPGRNLSLSGENIVYISLKENLGIATAQNLGIKEADSLGCNYIIFFDQDSSITIDLIQNLITSFTDVYALDPQVALVGPLIIERATGIPYKSSANLNLRYSYVNELISSGSVTTVDIIRKVGGMMDDLFIDWVDYEWCWRAKSKGFHCYMATQIRMEHMVGNGVIRLPGLKIMSPAPIRYYYIYRNLLILIRLKYVPFKWKYRQIIRRFIELLIVPIIRYKYCSNIIVYMIRGIREGLKY